MRKYPQLSKNNLVLTKKRKAPYLKHHLLYIPYNFNFITLEGDKTNWLVLYSTFYQVMSPIPSVFSSFSMSYNSGVLKLTSLVSNVYYKTYIEHFNYIVASFFKPYFIKIKFRGKGYYIYKNIRNTIAPQFGYSHRVYIYSYFNKVKFIGKTKVILFGLVKEDVLSAAYTLKSKRSINIFTGRGVRFAKQIVYKKQGKVSSYR